MHRLVPGTAGAQPALHQFDRSDGTGTLVFETFQDLPQTAKCPRPRILMYPAEGKMGPEGTAFDRKAQSLHPNFQPVLHQFKRGNPLATYPDNPRAFHRRKRSEPAEGKHKRPVAVHHLVERAGNLLQPGRIGFTQKLEGEMEDRFIGPANREPRLPEGGGGGPDVVTKG